MVATWIIVGLVFSAFSVSTLGAAFSVFGLRELFSGAAIAVVLMAASLEFAKFTLAAYLYERWNILNKFLRTYLTGSVAVLSIITSMGIYGFLSNAYQSSSAVYEEEQIKLTALQGQQDRNKAEVERLNKMVDEIPASRVTKRLELRKANEPAMAELNKSIAAVATQIDQSNLKVLEVKQKVGPLIYISKAFNIEIDNVVKYLILILVLVFDPLAISLVIAATESLASRRNGKTLFNTPTASPVAASNVSTLPTPPPAPEVLPEEDGEVIHMRFASSEQDEKAV